MGCRESVARIRLLMLRSGQPENLFEKPGYSMQTPARKTTWTPTNL
jgi:hypothetical protein